MIKTIYMIFFVCAFSLGLWACAAGNKKEVAVYCRSGRRSRTAADILVKKGFKVYNLDKGILNWMEEGREIEK